MEIRRYFNDYFKWFPEKWSWKLKDIEGNSQKYMKYRARKCSAYKDNDLYPFFDSIEKDANQFDMKNVELAYAITVHSSQGCEFPCCIFPVSSSYGPMLTKPLYYTGITRAKKKLVMIGDEEALKKAVRTTRTQGRKSLLGPRIIKRLRNM